MRTRKANWIAAIALAALVAGCGGGDSSGGQTPTGSTPAPSPATPAPATPAPATPAPATPTPSPAPTTSIPTDWNGGRAATYTQLPDIAACNAGVMSNTGLQDALQVMNGIRALHGLPAVTLSSADQQSAMEASLMMSANSQLSHTPPTTWKCYTALGAAGAGSSDLYASFPSANLSLMSNDNIFAGWMTEVNNLVANSVGHRRWILDPFLGTVAYGRVAGIYSSTQRIDSSALKVFNNTGGGVASAAAIPDYVAYPQGNYPARYFDATALFSFTAIVDKTTTWGGNSSVDFSAATITVKPTGGSTNLAVSAITFDNDGYGVPNNIQWKVAGVATGTSYDVTISNVKVRGVARVYSYSFKIV
ncbi:MAG: CAP domain-containing protein [Pseudomonadota bacterium]